MTDKPGFTAGASNPANSELREATRRLIDAIMAEQEHGDAYDTDCPVCNAIHAATRALSLGRSLEES